MQTRVRRCKGDTASSTTTVALVVFLLLGLLMLIVQYGLYFNTQQRAAAAADRAISVARWPDATEEQGEAAGLDFLEGARISGAPTVEVTRGVDEVQAIVTLTPRTVENLVPIEWTVTATATAPVERFIPEDEREQP